MKILYHHRIASKDGQYVHIDAIVNALKELGHEIVLVEPDSIRDKQFGKSSGMVKHLRSVLPGFVHGFMEFGYCFYDFFKIVRAIRRHRPDCIYERYNLFFPSGIWAKKLFGLPLVLEVNAPLFQERESNGGISLKWLAKWTETYVWRCADVVLPVTGVLSDIIQQDGVPEDRITVIPNGIDRHGRFNRATDGGAIRKKYELEDKLILGFTGFVREWHRLDRVLDVIHSNKDRNWHLLLIGDGPARPGLEVQAAELGIADRVTFTGLIGREQMPDFVAAFDIALQPDVVAYASPLKLFEYLGFGKAILAPDRPNIREIMVDGENGLLFSADQSSDFKEKLEFLAQSAELRARLGQGALDTVESRGLYWQENAKKIIELVPARTPDAKQGVLRN